MLAGRARRGSPVWLPRFLRREPGLRYEGLVHETVERWHARHGFATARLDCDIVHAGGATSVREARGKDDRNLALLQEWCRSERESVVPFGYLAVELLARGRAGEAWEAAERGWALVEGQPPSRNFSRLAAARGLLALERGLPGVALESARRAEAHDGPSPDLHLVRGRAHEAAGAGGGAGLGGAGERPRGGRGQPARLPGPGWRARRPAGAGRRDELAGLDSPRHRAARPGPASRGRRQLRARPRREARSPGGSPGKARGAPRPGRCGRSAGRHRANRRADVGEAPRRLGPGRLRRPGARCAGGRSWLPGPGPGGAGAVGERMAACSRCAASSRTCGPTSRRAVHLHVTRRGPGCCCSGGDRPHHR